MSKREKLGELITDNKENAEKLSAADIKVAYDKDKIEKKISKLILDNKQNAKELSDAYKIITIQKKELKKHAAKLIIADKELVFQNQEKEKRETANKELEAFSYSLKLASQYSLSLIEASLDPLVAISAQGKITDMNEALVNITGITREKLRKSNLQNDLMDRTITPQDYQDMKGRVEKDLVLTKDNLTDLQKQTSPFKNYILNEAPMLENLLEYYRKSDGATKKKILNTIFAEKLIVINGKVIGHSFTEPIKLMLRIRKSITNSKEKKEVDIDLKLLRSYRS